MNGIMAELGEFETTEHAAIGSLAAELGMLVVAVDTPGYSHSDNAVLVKKSRVAGLARLAERLITDGQTPDTCRVFGRC